MLYQNLVREIVFDRVLILVICSCYKYFGHVYKCKQLSQLLQKDFLQCPAKMHNVAEYLSEAIHEKLLSNSK